MSNEQAASSTQSHEWKFFRAGGFYQVRLDDGADLLALDRLDQKYWVTLACPTRGLEFDSRTLDLIDTDKDGRIRVPEVISAVAWACRQVCNPDTLLKGSPSLALSDINAATPEGKRMLDSARHVLASLDKKDAAEICVDDTDSVERIFSRTMFNGDGIIPPASAEDEATRAVIDDIISCVGGEVDRGGTMGVAEKHVRDFFEAAQAYSDWWAKAEKNAASILPLGENSLAAVEALNAVKAKVDDYFARCRLAAFDVRAIDALNRHESEYLSIAARDLTITASEVASFPLARVEAGKPLPLKTSLNPAWVEAVGRLNTQVVFPLLGPRDSLSEEEWMAITGQFADLSRWIASKAGQEVEPLGLSRVREILSGSYRQKISDLIARDKALEPEASAISMVDKLVRLNRDLIGLLNNYVSFRDFYGRRKKAAFQAGSLYLDQRTCDLCIRVDDVNKHAAIAHAGRMYLAYCDCVRPGTSEKMTIVAAFTAGDSDNLMVGRNGIFYDRKGQDWDAVITRIVENSISVRQAFWAPYKRILRWIEDQVAKHASTNDATGSQLVSAATTISKPADKPHEQKPKIDVGVVAALGVAVGGIAAALGALLQAFFGLGAWMPVGFLAVIMLISGPSMLIAWIKLQQRSLGPLLDANGWAINVKARINIPFGHSLTSTAKYPTQLISTLVDPYAENVRGRKWIIIGLIALAGIAVACLLGRLFRVW